MVSWSFSSAWASARPASRQLPARRSLAALKNLEAVAAEALRAVHRSVRRLQELGARLVGAGLDRDAHARGHRDAVVAVDLQRLRDRGSMRSRRRGDLRFVVDRVEQDGELVAAEARDRADLADRVREAGGDGAQQLVARLVPARVVDRLEPVEVEEEERRAHGRAACAPQRLVGQLVERRPVGEPGQLVVVGEAVEPLRAVPALRDVLRHREAGLHRTLVVAHGADRQAVDAAVARLDVELPALAAQRAAHRLGEALPGRGGQHVTQPAPAQGVVRERGLGERLALGHEQPQLVVEEHHGRVRQVAGEAGVELLAQPQRLLGGAAHDERLEGEHRAGALVLLRRRPQREARPERGAVLAPEDVDPARGAAVGEGPLDRRRLGRVAAAVRIGMVHQVVQRAPDRLLRAPAQQPHGGRVHGVDRAVGQQADEGLVARHGRRLAVPRLQLACRRAAHEARRRPPVLHVLADRAHERVDHAAGRTACPRALQLLDRRRSGSAVRYERSVVIALNASQQNTMRATSGISSPAMPSG